MTQIAIEWQANGKRLRKTVNTMQKVTIGRHPNCDIVLSDEHVSRRHAAIFFSDGSFHIQNTSLTNPILFNEQWPISNNLKADLQLGDMFIIGRVRLMVVQPQSGQSGNGLLSNSNQKALCPACEHLMDFGQEDCSWCGTSLAEAEMVELEVVKSFMDD